MDQPAESLMRDNRQRRLYALVTLRDLRDVVLATIEKEANDD